MLIYTRSFNRPTGLRPDQQWWIALDASPTRCLPASLRVRVNDRDIPSVEAPPDGPAALADRWTGRMPAVTASSCRLQIEVAGGGEESTPAPLPLLLATVRLLIEP